MDLLEPALKKIKLTEKILIVPDEVLCLLPFEALVEELPKGETEWRSKKEITGLYPKNIKYVGDNRVISYWQSGSTLTVTRHLQKRVDKGGILVVVDPVYNKSDERLVPSKNGQQRVNGGVCIIKGTQSTNVKCYETINHICYSLAMLTVLTSPQMLRNSLHYSYPLLVTAYDYLLCLTND